MDSAFLQHLPDWVVPSLYSRLRRCRMELTELISEQVLFSGQRWVSGSVFNGGNTWSIQLTRKKAFAHELCFRTHAFPMGVFAPTRVVEWVVRKLQNQCLFAPVDLPARVETYLKALRGSIDPEILKLGFALGLPENNLEAAVLAQHVSDYRTLLHTNPQLAFCLLAKIESFYAPRRGTFDRIRASLGQGGAMAALELLGWPRERRVLRVLRHIPIECLNDLERYPVQSGALRAALSDPLFCDRMVSLGIPVNQLHIAFHALFGTPAAGMARGLAELPRPGSERKSDVYRLKCIMQDTVQMQVRHNEDLRAMGRAGGVKALLREHDRLSMESRNSSAFGNLHPGELDLPFSVRVPASPWIKPVRTPREVVERAKEFCNCSASYLDRLCEGTYFLAIVKVPDTQKAMLGLSWDALESRWRIDQLFGVGNTVVSDVVLSRVREWLDRFDVLSWRRTRQLRTA